MKNFCFVIMLFFTLFLLENFVSDKLCLWVKYFNNFYKDIRKYEIEVCKTENPSKRKKVSFFYILHLTIFFIMVYVICNLFIIYSLFETSYKIWSIYEVKLKNVFNKAQHKKTKHLPQCKLEKLFLAQQ